MSASTFALTDVQREFRETLRAFCEEKVAPHAAEVDRTAEFPWKSFEACKEMELPALGIPEAYGGAGADTVTQAIAVEELARVCASTALTILISKLGMTAGHELGLRGAQAGVHAAGGGGRDPGQLLPVRGGRRERRGRPCAPGPCATATTTS